MKEEFETALFRFLRTYTSSFMLKDLLTNLGSQKSYMRKRELAEFLTVSRLAFSNPDGSFISRAGLFTNKTFSISPSKFEIQEGILIIGHRCMPFCNPDLFPHELSFFIKEKIIKKIPFIFSIDEIFPWYFLFGEEYIYQYLVLDNPENNRVLVSNDFDMPDKVIISVLEMCDLYKSWDFISGDRLLISVVNWDKGVLSIVPQCQHRDSRFFCTDIKDNQISWFTDIENLFLRSFNGIGPGTSMDDQAAYVFYIGRETLFSENCGSIEEFMNYTNKIGVELYGAESRFWRVNEEIPAFGSWTYLNYEYPLTSTEALFYDLGVPFSQTIIDACLFDSLYRKEANCHSLVKRISFLSYGIPERQQTLFIRQLDRRRELMAKAYNWFADYDRGKIRNRLLKLYCSLLSFISHLDIWNITPEELPHQSFVILSQLIGYITNLFDLLNENQMLTDEDINSIYISIESMEENLVDSRDNIIEAIQKMRKKLFSVISLPEED